MTLRPMTQEEIDDLKMLENVKFAFQSNDSAVANKLFRDGASNPPMISSRYENWIYRLIYRYQSQMPIRRLKDWWKKVETKMYPASESTEIRRAQRNAWTARKKAGSILPEGRPKDSQGKPLWKVFMEEEEQRNALLPKKKRKKKRSRDRHKAP